MNAPICKPPLRRRAAAVLALAAASVVGACMASAVPEPVAPAPVASAPVALPEQSLAKARAAVDAALPLACNTDGDCASLPLGARACGGPDQHLAYSLRDGPNPGLQDAAKRYTALRQRQVAKAGEASICQVLPDPSALCNAAKQCQLRQARTGAAGAAMR